MGSKPRQRRSPVRHTVHPTDPRYNITEYRRGKGVVPLAGVQSMDRLALWDKNLYEHHWNLRKAEDTQIRDLRARGELRGDYVVRLQHATNQLLLDDIRYHLSDILKEYGYEYINSETKDGAPRFTSVHRVDAKAPDGKIYRFIAIYESGRLKSIIREKTPGAGVKYLINGQATKGYTVYPFSVQTVDGETRPVYPA